MSGVFDAKGSGAMARYNTVMKDPECAKDYLCMWSLVTRIMVATKQLGLPSGTLTIPTSITSQPKELLALFFDLSLRHPQ